MDMSVITIRTDKDFIGIFQLFIHDRNIFPKTLAIDTSCKERAISIGYNMVCCQQHCLICMYFVKPDIALPRIIQRIINYQGNGYGGSHLTFQISAFSVYGRIGSIECHT